MKYIILLICLVSTVAFAQTNTKTSFTVNAGLMSDYIARGTSQSLGKSTANVGADLVFPNGIYAGAWTSNMDFGDGTDREIDFWLGYRFAIGKENLDVSLLNYGYMNDPGEWDMQEVKLVWSGPIVGKLSRTVTVAYTPDYFNVQGKSIWAEGLLTYEIHPKVTITAGYGKQFIWEYDEWSYGTWNAGFIYNLCTSVSMDFRYYDTDSHHLGSVYESALVATIRFTF